MSREDPHFRLRIPAELREEIREAATTNGRSMNAEIVARLSGQQRTLRDEIAMQALAPLLRESDGEEVFTFDGEASAYCVIAEEAYAVADAMMKAREAQQ